MVAARPERYVATMSKAKRAGKIFIDYLRNARSATAICAYSTRARAGAPVSVPLRWDELTADLREDHFNIRNVPARLRKLRKDPWDGYETARRPITAATRKRLGLK
jgi:bifunctional non-homologous end joining protein LigD